MRRRSRYGWLELIEGILLILLRNAYAVSIRAACSAESPWRMAFLAVSHRNFRYCILCENRPLYRLRTYHCAGDGNP